MEVTKKSDQNQQMMWLCKCLVYTDIQRNQMNSDVQYLPKYLFLKNT